MKDWFSYIQANCELPTHIAEELETNGFVVIPDLVKRTDLAQFERAYDSVAASASSDNRIGSATTRINDFVNRGSEFDSLYIYQPLLAASCHIINQPFKLSTLHARTQHSNSLAQKLHIDFKPDEEKFPLVSFIVMVDEFRRDNGATRFVPGSHNWSTIPNKLAEEALADYENQTVKACGKRGSIIIFYGSVWHGYSANTTASPRRSIQGAFIPRDAQAGTNFSIRMRSETLARISPLAKYLLAI